MTERPIDPEKQARVDEIIYRVTLAGLLAMRQNPKPQPKEENGDQTKRLEP